MNARCCWPPDSSRSGRLRAVGEADALDRLGDGVAVVAAEAAERTQRRAARLDHLAHGRRRVRADARALGEVADPRAVAERRGRLAEEQHASARRPLEPEREPQQRRLAAAVRAGDRDELAVLDAQVDAGEHRPAARVGEVDAVELERLAATRAPSAAWRGCGASA